MIGMKELAKILKQCIQQMYYMYSRSRGKHKLEDKRKEM